MIAQLEEIKSFDKPHKYGCLMAMLPDDLRKTLTDWSLENVPDFHLGKGGYDLTPHVTILYGFKDGSEETIQALRAMLSRHGPIELGLNGISLFTGENEDGHVLKLDVDSPDLEDLNYNIRNSFDCENKYPEYVPHVTLCYLDPSISSHYEGIKAPFDKEEVTVNSVLWSGADNETEEIPLSFLPLFGQNKAIPDFTKVQTSASPKASQNKTPFTGQKEDQAGRTYCFQQGERVPCNNQEQKPQDKTKQPSADSSEEKSKLPDDSNPPDPTKNTKPPWKMSREEFKKKIHVFKTAKGSMYVYANGQTVRYKVPHVGHDKSDHGLKAPSEQVFFVNALGAQKVGMWNSTQGASGRRMLVRGNEILLVSKNPQTGKVGLDERLSFSHKPEKGAYPVEVWKRDNKKENIGEVPGVTAAYTDNHPGNAITEMGRPSDDFYNWFVKEAEKGVSHKSLSDYETKSAGQPCKKGETAEKTECIPSQPIPPKVEEPADGKLLKVQQEERWRHKLPIEIRIFDSPKNSKPNYPMPSRKLISGVLRDDQAYINDDDVVEFRSIPVEELKFREGRKPNEEESEKMKHPEKVYPITVRKQGNKYIIQEGHHRATAFEKAGHEYIWAVVISKRKKTKALSYQAELTGGAIVSPSRQVSSGNIEFHRNRTQPVRVNRPKFTPAKTRRKPFLLASQSLTAGVDRTKALRAKYKAYSLQDAGAWLARKWRGLEDRYGRKQALTMAIAMLATLPVPGNVAAIVGIAEGIRGLHGYYTNKTSNSESYFASCERDQAGHCKSVSPSPFRKHLLSYQMKDVTNGTCEQGERADLTGCSPATKTPSSRKPKQTETQTPVKRRAVVGKLVSAKRVGKGKEAKVVLSNGQPAPEHITPAMIPPAWKNVKISINPDADVMVKAKDAAGRSKTIYNVKYEANNQAAKFAKIREGLIKQKDIYEQNQQNRKSEDPTVRNAADCIWLMQEQGTRPGSEDDTKGFAELYNAPFSRENVAISDAKKKGEKKVSIKIGDTEINVRDAGAREEIQRLMETGEDVQDASYWLKSYGASTLEGRHVVQTKEGVRLRFMGKESKWHDHLVKNPELAKMLLQRKDKAGEKGLLFDTDYNQVAKQVKRLDGGGFTPKDLRTMKGTSLAIEEINQRGDCCASPEEYKKTVMDVAAKVSGVLGNNPEMALEKYIDPTVWGVWRNAE